MAVARFPSQATLPQTTAPTSETEQILKELEELELTLKTWFANSKSRYYHHAGYSNELLYEDLGTYPNGHAIPSEFYLNTWYEVDASMQILRAVSIISDVNGNVLSTQTLVDGMKWVDFDTGKVATELTEAMYLIPGDKNLRNYYRFGKQAELTYRHEWLQDETYTVVVFSSEYPEGPAQPDLSNIIVTEAQVIGFEREVFYNKETGYPDKENSYYRLTDGTTVLISGGYSTFQPVSELPANIVKIMEWAKSQ